jgi:two-component system, OmpR family, sensor kinase
MGTGMGTNTDMGLDMGTGTRMRRWLDSVPLRGRLVAVLVLITSAALAVTGAVAVNQLSRQLVAGIDEQIGLTTAALLDDPESILRRLGTPGDSTQPKGPVTSTYAVVVWDLGTLTPLSPWNHDTPSLWPGTSPAAITDHQGEPLTVDARRGSGQWRVKVSRLVDVNYGSGTLLVGQSLSGVQDTVARMTLFLLVVGLAVLAAIGALGWHVIGRALRPLREVEEVAQTIAAGDLGRRVPVHPPSTEVGRLAGSLNAMLAQIEQAFTARTASEERMRRFVSDASHELRTPLAAVRGYAELYRQGAVSEPDDVGTAMRRIETEATRMGSLVEDLLTLARLDEQRPAGRVPVDLTVLAADAVQDARALDPDRMVRLIGGGTRLGPTLVLGDESKLRQVIGNLVANALRHTPAGSPIEICVSPNGQDGRLEVRDHGPGLSADQVQHVFERFFRADASRQRASGGSGLGLAIVAAIVSQHGGRVSVQRTEGGGATFAFGLRLVHPADSQEPLSEVSSRRDVLEEQHGTAGG